MWLFDLGLTPRAKHPRKARRYVTEWLHTPLGKVKDLSTTGMRIAGTGRPTISKGSVTQLKLMTPQGELNFVARVAWVKRVKEGFEAGLELLDVKPQVAARLRTLGELGFVPGSAPALDPANTASTAPKPVSSKPSPYAVLGIDATASDDEVQKAYRRLARSYHPDVNKSPEAVARFEQIVDAYHRLQKSRLGFGVKDSSGDPVR
jgi:hypothetical protein